MSARSVLLRVAKAIRSARIVNGQTAGVATSIEQAAAAVEAYDPRANAEGCYRDAIAAIRAEVEGK